MIVGYTGTQQGMTSKQKHTLSGIVATILFIDYPTSTVGEHGDCIGGDAEFDALLQILNVSRRCRPCTVEKKRAHTKAKIIASPEKPLVRNEKIVIDSHVMLACPKEMYEIVASGTWTTVRHARKHKKPLVIVYPDGSYATENF